MSRSRVYLAAAILAAVAAFGFWPDRRRPDSEFPRWEMDAAAQNEAVPAAGPSPAGPDRVPVTLHPNRLQSIGVKTGAVEYRPVRGEIRTFGNVEADETRLSDVQVRFSGWVQKIYADATFKAVRQGQPLLTIYSPELVTAEQEYLVAKGLLAQGRGPAGTAGWHSLVDASLERLKRLQIPEREIARLT
ncbi:MAG: efflux RND transporter periplasmic adaptor subunit, partial [Beijerinckiaceae bacterium]|nr:efflux RND transporter periplasmic adaptor subunit [Beijerinckiaceae bacterium]